MVPDKPLQQQKPSKERVRQASLLDAPEDKPDNIDQIVSRAFDADPLVRLKVAQELSSVDDPRAIFALIELSSDKDENVKGTAQRALGHFKEEQAEIVSLEKLLAERKAPAPAAAAAPTQSQAQAATEARANMMPTIEKLFAHYEPKKRESVKRKLLPSLQKLFGFRPEELDPLREIDKISPAQVASAPVQAEVKRVREERGIPKENAANFPFGKHEEPSERVVVRQKEEKAEKSDLVELDFESSEFVGTHESEEEESHEADEYAMRHGRLFEMAFRLATTPGTGKAELKREQARLVTAFKKEVEAAFKLASIKASEEGLASLSNLKPGMKNLSFGELGISSISEVAYGARKRPFYRLEVTDGKRTVPFLVPRERGSGISVADKIAPKKVSVDFIVDKGEVILIASGKSRIVVVK